MNRTISNYFQVTKATVTIVGKKQQVTKVGNILSTSPQTATKYDRQYLQELQYYIDVVINDSNPEDMITEDEFNDVLEEEQEELYCIGANSMDNTGRCKYS